MKGEWAKGLLPQSSVRTDYTVQRICGSYISHYLASLSSALDVPYFLFDSLPI